MKIAASSNEDSCRQLWRLLPAAMKKAANSYEDWCQQKRRSHLSEGQLSKETFVPGDSCPWRLLSKKMFTSEKFARIKCCQAQPNPNPSWAKVAFFQLIRLPTHPPTQPTNNSQCIGMRTISPIFFWLLLFLAATAAQEAHLSVRASVT